MQLFVCIALDLGVERCRSPLLCEEWNGDYLAKSVDLEAAAAHCTDNTGVVNDVYFDSGFDTAQVEICVSCGAEWVSHDKE